MNILIAAGPTREFIDDVRYISNSSSGRMGSALVNAARTAGHRVTFICGPVELAMPKCFRTVSVTSAEDMRRAVKTFARQADAVVMAAAVADYRPATRTRGKMKKSAKSLTLRLVPTVDILVELGRTRRRGQVLVGFALEAKNGRRNAERKLREKNLDLIVLNAPAAMGAATTTAELIAASGDIETMTHVSKPRLARRIVRRVEELHLRSGR